jgi:multiple sugar transport system substrate-binding protein
MTTNHKASKLGRRKFIAATAAAAGLASLPRRAPAQQAALKLISHRNPSLEYYMSKFTTAIPGVRVDSTLVPIDKAFELQTIALSSGSDSMDFLMVNDPTLKRFARSGWLRPLDDLWAKYKNEYELGDFPQSVLDAFTMEGKLYAVPLIVNSMFFFYRVDLFKEKNLNPPKTFDEYISAAQTMHSPRRAGTVLNYKPVDGALNETHWYLNAHGGSWFDDRWRPTFNNAQGVKAVETLKNVARFAPPGFTSHANDESTINLQQDLAAMGMQWFTRAGAMDDPAKSKVVGQIAWAVPPGGGGQRLAVDGYAISKFSKADPDVVFRLIMEAGKKESMRGAAAFAMPVRNSLLGDTDLQQKYRFYPAALAALEVAKPLPSLPEFLEVGELIVRRLHQAVSGESPVKVALDAAATEVEDALRRRGYYR